MSILTTPELAAEQAMQARANAVVDSMAFDIYAKLAVQWLDGCSLGEIDDTLELAASTAFRAVKTFVEEANNQHG